MSDVSPQREALQAIRGMNDILPNQVVYFQFLENIARELFDLYGYREIRTPILEPTELFDRSAGEASDVVVSKQMYTFQDPGERMNTMRPEGTAGVVRALVQSGLLKETSQQKLYYSGPMFRYEKPQKGRFRQFTQVGLEFFGVAHPAADVEVIILCDTYLRRLGFSDISLKLNSIGCRQCRADYNQKLREAISAASGAGWCEYCLRRAELNPMRVFDCKVEQCKTLVEDLPRISGSVCTECGEHFASVKNLLDAAGVKYELDDELVRGFDYYSRTVFEIVQGGLGAQNAVLGGGRYDYLVEELGGPATPAVGMSVGVERLIMAMQSIGIELPGGPRAEYYILALDEQSLPTAQRLAQFARSCGVRVCFECQPKSARAGLKAANRSGAGIALIVGADELSRDSAQWKNLETGEQMELLLTEIERNVSSI